MKLSKTLKMGFVVIAVSGLTACFDSDNDEVAPLPVNNSPQAMSVDFTTQTETAFTEAFPASDPDGDTLSFSISTAPNVGEVTVNDDGTFTYTPFFELTGNDSFSFSVTDPQGLEASGSVNITVEALQVQFTQFARDAFNAGLSDKPLSLNGREFIQDGVDASDYQELIDNN